MAWDVAPRSPAKPWTTTVLRPQDQGGGPHFGEQPGDVRPLMREGPGQGGGTPASGPRPPGDGDQRALRFRLSHSLARRPLSLGREIGDLRALRLAALAIGVRVLNPRPAIAAPPL